MRGHVHIARNGHTVTGASRPKGKTPIRPQRVVYGYDLRCTCGWRRNGRAQEHKPEAEGYARNHLDSHAEGGR